MSKIGAFVLCEVRPETYGVIDDLNILPFTGVLISPPPDQEGNMLMFLSEWREFHSAPCLARKKNLDDSSRLHVVEIARVPDMLPSFFPSWSG